MATDIRKGLIHIYTGDGKGKTTAALGLAIRASGYNLKVIFIQFMKGIPSGEINFISQYNAFPIIQLYSGDSFTKSLEQLALEAQKTLVYSQETILNGSYDMVILDEIFVAVSRGLISTDAVIKLLEIKPGNLELILTGRHAPEELVRRADLVTEMLMIKHPYTQGIKARIGIEY